MRIVLNSLLSGSSLAKSIDSQAFKWHVLYFPVHEDQWIHLKLFCWLNGQYLFSWSSRIHLFSLTNIRIYEYSCLQLLRVCLSLWGETDLAHQHYSKWREKQNVRVTRPIINAIQCNATQMCNDCTQLYKKSLILEAAKAERRAKNHHGIMLKGNGRRRSIILDVTYW